MNQPAFTPPAPAPQLLSASARLGPVHLDVTDGDRARRFWMDDIGLALLEAEDDRIALGAGREPLIVLHPGATGPVARRHTGLYHVAIHLPSAVELARVVARLDDVGYPNSPTDHAETMATYLSDPDGNGIELTFETPERGALMLMEGRGGAVMADGTMQGPTEPLDVRALLGVLADDEDLAAPMSSGARIGHIHLHVNDLEEARRFYRDLIGFGDLRAMDAWGMSDLSLETSFVPHALAVNIWNGRLGTPRPEGTAGLRYWTVLVPDGDIDAITGRLARAGHEWSSIEGGIAVHDPFGNALRILAQA